MIKQIAKLNESRNKIESILSYDIDSGQLVDLCNKQEFSLLIDLTGLVPQPEIGWLYDGRNFSEPPDIIQTLDDTMHSYIVSHYGDIAGDPVANALKFFYWQSYLQMVFQDPTSSEARKAAAMAAGDWIKSIVQYYKSLILKYMGGQTLTPEETNWPALFDASDPGINLLNLPD